MRSANSYVGQPIERIEDLRFVRGRGQYVDDVTRPEQLFAVILRSAVAHGRLKSVNANGCARASGRPRRYHRRRDRHARAADRSAPAAAAGTRPV